MKKSNIIIKDIPEVNYDSNKEFLDKLDEIVDNKLKEKQNNKH